MESAGWTPILTGETYCSPRCGGRCKKVDFDTAHERAAELAAQMGDGWEPCVWENLGWYWSVFKGTCRISPHLPTSHKGEHRLMLMWDFPIPSSDNKVPQIILHGSDPAALLGLAKQDARTWIARVEAELARVQ